MTRETSRHRVQRLAVDQYHVVPSWRGWRIVRLASTASVVIALAGCTAMQQRVGGWFGAATPTPMPTPTPRTAAAAAARVYFAGTEGMKLYSEPSAASKVVGELSLHEKVTRSKLERGFAYVESAKSGVKGWVNNAQLIWRLPGAPTPAVPGAAEHEPEAPVVPAVEESQPPEVPEAPATFAQPTATPTSAAAAAAPPTPKATPRGAAPSIFDAY